MKNIKKTIVSMVLVSTMALTSICASATVREPDKWIMNDNGTMSCIHNNYKIKDRIAILSDGIYAFNIQGEKIINSWYAEKSLRGDVWYYLGVDGNALLGWQLINGKWYYFSEYGTMITNRTINGYKLGNDGAWIQ